MPFISAEDENGLFSPVVMLKNLDQSLGLLSVIPETGAPHFDLEFEGKEFMCYVLEYPEHALESIDSVSRELGLEEVLWYTKEQRTKQLDERNERLILRILEKYYTLFS